MQLKAFIFTILLLAASGAGAADLLVKVLDAEKKQALQAAQVKCILPAGQTIMGQTDSNGQFVLKNVVYPVQIRCTSVGYVAFSHSISFEQVNHSEGKQKYEILLEKNVQNMAEVVVTGQIVPVLAKQSIYKVNTISSEQITQRAAVNLGDALGFEMNQLISNDNILGSSTSMGGLGGQNVKILINGVPVLGRENGNIDLGQLNLNNVKRIEMIQGPMSVMYGSNALGGVINLITNSPQKKLNFGVRTYLESIGRYNFSGYASWMKKNHQFQLSLARNYFQGWTPEDSVDRFQLWKPKTQYTADLMYHYARNKFKFSYFGSYLHEKISNKGVPIVNPYEGYAFDEYYRTMRQIHSATIQIQLNEKEQLQFINSFTPYTRTKNRFKKDLVTLQQFETPSVGDQDTSRFNMFNLRGSFTSKRLKNTELLLGYELSHETGKSDKLADITQKISDLGVFGSLNYRIGNWNFQPSVRYTLNSQFGNSWSPAFHSKWHISERTQFRASYARGFRAPSLKEMYLQFIDQNHTILGNPDLQPEIGDHAEMGLDYQHPLEGQKALGFHFTSYYNHIKNLITLAVYNNHGILRQYQNIEEYSNWIQNLQVKFSTPRWSISTGASYTAVQAAGFVPEHQIFETVFQASYYWKWAATNVNFNYKYNDKQPVLSVDNQFFYTDPIHIANCSVQRSFFNRHLSVQAGIKNLFNIQNSALNGATTNSGSGHSNSTGMQVFPNRSIFFDLIYNFK
jgi:outer membrane receptor for ferrienterochelin and colicins